MISRKDDPTQLGRHGRRLLMASAAGLAMASCLSMTAAAQVEDEQAKGESALGLEEIVITGRVGGAGLRKLDASYAITSLTNADIDRFAPKSTADLFKAVPGVWAESSGGEAGANVFVRGFPAGGDAEFVTLQIDGVPIFPPPTLSFLENSSLFRIDETVERFEALRGGPNTVLSNGQPGVTFNFIQKKGGPETEGLVKLSGTDFGEKRLDLHVSGPISDDLYYSVGGFYRTSNGIRDAEFNSERGGQISANITKVFDNGEVNLYTRFLDDRAAWLLPIPLLSDDEGNISEFPGFDRGTGNLIGNANRLARLEVGPGEFIDRDLADGRGAELFIVGGSAEFDYSSGWAFSTRFNYLSGDANTIGLVPDVAPTSAGAFLEGFTNNPEDFPDLVGLDGTFTFTGTDTVVGPNQQVLTAGFWSVEKDIQAFTSDSSVSKEIFENNTFTVGLYFSDYSSNDVWYLGNQQLLAAEENARRIDLVLSDGTRASRDGFIAAPGFVVNAAYNGRNIAAYFSDEWQITPDLRIDAGIRVENQNVDGSVDQAGNANNSGIDLDGDPTTLFNNNAAVLTGAFRSIDFDETEVSWTAGANYNLSQDMSVFARINSGRRFPQFDNLRDGLTGIQDIDQYEVGFKASTDYISVFSTLFYNDFRGRPEQRFIDGQPFTLITSSTAIGLEGEVVVRPFQGFNLAVTGTWQDAEFDSPDNIDGNRVQRQPKIQIRFSPSYDIELPWGLATVYGTLTHVGDRFSDVENAQVLDSYQKLDAGIVADVGESVTLQVSADNLTDSHALTEGNPRVLGAQTGTAIYARPILGRSFRFSLSYNF